MLYKKYNIKRDEFKIYMLLSARFNLTMAKCNLARAWCPEKAPRAAFIIIRIATVVLLENTGIPLSIVIVLFNLVPFETWKTLNFNHLVFALSLTLAKHFESTCRFKHSMEFN